MTIYRGNSQATKLYVGRDEVQKMYVGRNEVYSAVAAIGDRGDLPVGSPTATSMQTSVTDPVTGHVFTFTEPREVGQYQDGTWFVVGGAGNAVSIASISPESTSVSTAGYSQPDNCDDIANTGARTRWMHGTMVNPQQGKGASGEAYTPLGFDSYYGFAQNARSVPYQHSYNVDPGKTGSPLTLTEGSVVKSESFTGEGGHTANEVDKTRMLKMSCLTVVPEVPTANSFRPPIRGTDKRSYWTTDMLDIESVRRKINGFRPVSTAAIQASTNRLKYIQQTFLPFQEQARRWNPGARGGGVGIYGNNWYYWFERSFLVFHGDYELSEIEELVRATIQVGIDIYGLLIDRDHYRPWQAHHAGRKGIVMMAGLCLGDDTILDQCRYEDHPEHFGVDDAYCGYVSSGMVGQQQRFHKGQYPYKWEREHVGVPEWAFVFTGGHTRPTAARTREADQINDADIARRAYQVLSFDNGAMSQCLWGMIVDPRADYYNPAYFDFTDRYLAIRFGDQIDGKWDASSNASGTNNHFTGNWWSINPSQQAIQNFKTMRDACTRDNYVTELPPEAMPAPRVTHDGVSGHLDINFNRNNYQCPQNKDVRITGYDLRYCAYTSAALNPSGPNDPNLVRNADWIYHNDISLPYQLAGVPRGTKIKVQLRMRNVNGDGPWLDGRFLENYDGNAQFRLFAARDRYTTNFDVPDIAAFDQAPTVAIVPRITPSKFISAGQTLTGSEGEWIVGSGTITTAYRWQRSANGTSGWTTVTTGQTTYTPTGADEGQFLRFGVQKTSNLGQSEFSYSEAVAVNGALLTPVYHGSPADLRTIPIGSALGGRHFVIITAHRSRTDKNTGGMAGATALTELFATTNREWQQVMYVSVPAGEIATNIVLSENTQESLAVVVLESEVPLDTRSGQYQVLNTTDGTGDSYRRAVVNWNISTYNGGGVGMLTRSTTSNMTISGNLTNIVSGSGGSYAAAYAAVTDGSDINVSCNYTVNFNRTGTIVVMKPA